MRPWIREKVDVAEQERAERVSAVVDGLLRDPDAHVEGQAEDAPLLDTARRLARLPALLGSVDPALEQQVMCRVRTTRVRARWPWLRLAWAAAGLAAALLLALLLTPLGQTAVAGFLGVFHLGRTDVQIAQVGTATAMPVSTARVERLTLQEAQERLSFALSQPAYLPAGYQLREVNSHTYPDLPEWVPQPLFVDLIYGDGAGQTCTLRIYPITLGEKASISGLNVETTSVEKVQDLDINGQPGVLLQVGTTWQQVVWEQNDTILALWATDLDTEELLKVARSVGSR